MKQVSCDILYFVNFERIKCDKHAACSVCACSNRSLYPTQNVKIGIVLSVLNHLTKSYLRANLML